LSILEIPSTEVEKIEKGIKTSFGEKTKEKSNPNTIFFPSNLEA